MKKSIATVRLHWVGVALLASVAPAGGQTVGADVGSVVRASATVLPPSMPSGLAISPATPALPGTTPESLLVSLCENGSQTGWTATMALVAGSSGDGAELEWSEDRSAEWERLPSGMGILGSDVSRCQVGLRLVPLGDGMAIGDPDGEPVWVTVQLTADRT